jgi:hypothetical protein
MQIVSVAQRACQIERNHWNVHNLGMAHYRNGEFEPARRHIEEAVLGSQWYLYFPGLAMTHHALGNADAAREWLEKAEERFRYFSDSSAGHLKALDADPFWQDWAYFEAMLLEARTLINVETTK